MLGMQRRRNCLPQLPAKGSVLKTNRYIPPPLVDQRFLRSDFAADIVLSQLRRHLLSFCLTGAIVLGSGAPLAAERFGAADATPTAPVLVELFTSEGCSSCPPADALVERMDSLQPVPGVQLIVLSEHVDYWNHDGWKDPFSSASISDRQSDYVRALGLKSPYTPQVIVDGSSDLRLSDPQQVEQTFQKAATIPKLPIRILVATRDPKNSDMVRVQVEVQGNSITRNADLYEVVALDHAESQVLRGENSGKHLTHVAVMQNLTKIGRLEKGKDFSREVETKLKPGTDPSNVRLIIFAQEAGPGR